MAPNTTPKIVTLEHRVSPEEFAETAFTRVRRAIDAYRELASGWGDEAPSMARVADIAVDAGIAAEAALKGIVDHLGVPRPRTREAKMLLALFEIVAELPEMGGSFGTERRAYIDALDVIRLTRNRAVHGGVPQAAPEKVLRALRDTIRLVLLLGVAYPLLSKLWTLPYRGIRDELWAFDGQPEYFATQVYEAFSDKRFDALGAKLRVARYTGGSNFWLSGLLNVASGIEQSHWFTVRAGSIMKMIPSVKAEIGMIPPPERGDTRTPEGSTITEGVITLIARDIDACVDGFPDSGNPLLAPIRLTPQQDDAWMVGPGDLRLVRLSVELPYRVHARWFTTPDGRLEVCSQFLESNARGAVDGMLAFQYPGHGAKPAYRGTAGISGSAGACAKGSQIAQWRVCRNERGHITSWLWEDVTRLHLWSELALSLTFGKVEIFR